jgi:hypothetical protein
MIYTGVIGEYGTSESFSAGQTRYGGFESKKMG